MRGKATATVTDSTLGTATAADHVQLASLIRSGVPAGNVFAIGVTTITWTGTDIFADTVIASAPAGWVGALSSDEGDASIDVR